MEHQDGAQSNSPSAILRFWRDVEIFNIPSVPKLESKRTDQGRPTLQTKIYPVNAPLPWIA